jgi:hypothetical protein
MQHNYPTTEQAQADAGDGVERTVTQARGGVRRGMLKVLLISTMTAIAVMGAIIFFCARPGPRAAPAAAPGSPAPSGAATLASGTWDASHLGANGLEKCQAFRMVVMHTHAFQADGGGTISTGQRSSLQAELNAAEAMAPKSLTPAQCGVPL